MEATSSKSTPRHSSSQILSSSSCGISRGFQTRELIVPTARSESFCSKIPFSRNYSKYVKEKQQLQRKGARRHPDQMPINICFAHNQIQLTTMWYSGSSLYPSIQGPLQVGMVFMKTERLIYHFSIASTWIWHFIETRNRIISMNRQQWWTIKYIKQNMMNIPNFTTSNQKLKW